MKAYFHIFIAAVLVVLLSFEAASAYEPAVQWQKTFGGSDSDSGYSVQQTKDGGYIIAGTTESFGAEWLDVYLIKTDFTGNFLWQKTFGGSDFDWGYSVQQATDGGYVIAGTTCSFGDPVGDVYLIKTDPNGNLLWQKTFGGTNSDLGFSVQQTSDDGYIIAGATGSFGDPNGDVYLIKTNKNGNMKWQKTFGGSKGDYGYSVQQTSDGGFIIAGTTVSFGAGRYDVYLIKTHPNGSSQWQKTFGGRYEEWGYSVQQTSDGGYIIAGVIGSRAGVNVYLIKTDPYGNQEWQKTFGGSYPDLGLSVQQTSDGGFIIAGWTCSFGAGDPDVYLIKTNPDGNLLWQKTFGGSKANDGAYSIQQTFDGGYIIAGGTGSFGAGGGDVYLIKLSAEVCRYVLFGDVNSDCKFDFYDFALMSANWLIDCNINPSDTACLSE